MGESDFVFNDVFTSDVEIEGTRYDATPGARCVEALDRLRNSIPAELFAAGAILDVADFAVGPEQRGAASWPTKLLYP